MFFERLSNCGFPPSSHDQPHGELSRQGLKEPVPQTVAEFKVNLGVSQLTQVREKHLDLRLIFARLSAPRPNPSIFKAKRGLWRTAVAS